MKVPQRVIWSEGCSRVPTAPQQLDRYHEGFIVEARLAALVPHHDWGVVALELDERARRGGPIAHPALRGVLLTGSLLA